MEFRAIKCESANDAMQTAEASGCGVAVMVEGIHYAMTQPEADRLAAAGVEMAYLIEDGEHRIMTVPVN